MQILDEYGVLRGRSSESTTLFTRIQNSRRACCKSQPVSSAEKIHAKFQERLFSATHSRRIQERQGIHFRFSVEGASESRTGTLGQHCMFLSGCTYVVSGDTAVAAVVILLFLCLAILCRGFEDLSFEQCV